MSRILLQPHTREALKSGIDTLAAAITPTLGPLTGPVALDDAMRKGSPELLDDGGAIARRVLQLEDRDADVGAMLLRETLWQQRERHGDATATAAVLYQTVFAEGHRFISAGGDAMSLRRHLDTGMKLILRSLQEQVHQILGTEAIEQLALSISGDGDVAAALADIFDVLSPHSPVEVRDGGRDLQHEFFLGSFWESKVPSNIVFEGIVGNRLELINTAWLISDFELNDVQALVALVTDVYEAGYDSLAIVAKSFSEQVVAAQGANGRMEDFTLVYLEPTGLVDEQEAALEDLALLTGGQVLRAIAGHKLEDLDRGSLGKSELAWLDRNRFGIISGGAGDADAIGREITALERRFEITDDERRQDLLGARIGRLRGGSAVIYCGGSSESEMRYRQERVNRAITTLRAALLKGILPGGGTALIRCIKSLQAAHDMSDDFHERAAYKILMTVAQAPCRRLLENAGHEYPGVVINDIVRSGNGYGLALSADGAAEIHQSGIVDSAAALMAAVRNGIGGAALALTVDTIVHRVNPPLAIEPGGLPASAKMGNIELK